MTPLPVEALIRDRIGLDTSSLGESTVDRAVRGRMQARGTATRDAYSGLLAADPVEWAALLGDLLVGETWFFRGGRSLFDHLAGWLRERVGTHVPGHPVCVLAAPCSTGEEPYSLAIALDAQGVPPTAYRIDAIDLAPAHLARAAAGVYPAFAFREPEPDPRAAHFRPVANGRWELQPRIRQGVRFRPANLTDPGFLAGDGPYDLILCRNLFIYLTPEARGRVMANIDRLLASDGRVCMTPTEADRVPAARFVADGPTGFALFRRTEATEARPTVAGTINSAPKSGVFSRLPADPGPKSGVLPRPGGGRVEPPKPPPVDEPTRITKPLPADPLAVARELADAGKLDQAWQVCEQQIRAGAGGAGVFSLLGVVHLAAGRQDEAAAAFRKALYLDPDHAEALTHMIVLHERRGEAGPAAALRRRLARVEHGGRT